MSSHVSAAPNSIRDTIPDVTRRSANFHPSIWGDYFVCHTFNSMFDDHFEQEFYRLKEEVKEMLYATTSKLSQQLNFIDVIQRLGVSYLFESDIDQMLCDLYHQGCGDDYVHDHDLQMVALRFRLLRQQGHYVSCDVFKKFKDTEGNFKVCLANDIQGMLSLYEATHLRVYGEDILEEAHTFATTHLNSITTADMLCPPLLVKLRHALDQPIHKDLPWLGAKRYISSYEQEASHSEVLLKFAKLNFNFLQNMHQKELADITMWWKKVDLSKKLPFARDRLVECYFWILGVCFEPQYSFARIIMTKVIAMTSVMDDVYDVYGTMEELVLFTDAIERWDISNIDHLPEYMKYFYNQLLDVYKEIETGLAEQGRSYRVDYAKEAMKKQVQAYFVEARWLHENYMPTMDEYMRISLISSGYPLLTCISFVGMGDIVTKDAFEWLNKDPKIVKAASVIARLMDDIVSHKFEQERGHVASAIECYMNQHEVAEEQASDELRRQVVEAWKDINEELLIIPKDHVPIPLLTRVLNLARVMDVMYKDGDGYTNANGKVRNYITSLLIEPVQLATSSLLV
ncbi:(-)-germacrene D synthase [Populus alba]|uniref:Isoprene synthase, chloroplastic n=1 Tax=Populus alba TaxID=43335 RepID=A0A4V6A9S6_POPAL|nr:(-)-germacrene D synthase-like [Populus alba]TKS05576.1 (-)-germacrene D synthase-like isoform X2 [Populus alba]